MVKIYTEWSEPVTVKIYGIKQCDTMKKTFRWFEAHQIDIEFHDYKREGVSPQSLKEWIGAFGWEVIINRRGTTWRKLDDARKHSVDNESAIALCTEQPSMIKRPIIEWNNEVLVGFNAERLSKQLENAT